MPHPIFEIDELLRLIIDELVNISPRAVVSFALTCRSLEEPTLSLLWKRQRSLANLVKVLPQYSWIEGKRNVRSLVGGCDFLPDQVLRQPQVIKPDPPHEDWGRLQQYASWMDTLFLGLEDNITIDALSCLSRNSPDGVLCPKLEHLVWRFDDSTVPLSSFRLFFSPHLKRVTLSTYFRRHVFGPELVASLCEVVSCLPDSLENMCLMCGQGGEPLKDAISSYVCRSGLSLRSFGSSEPLSDAAFEHLMQLPNLRSWIATHEPPRTPPLATFPALEELHLYPEALPWLHLLAGNEDGQLRSGLAPAAILSPTIGETLKTLGFPSHILVDPKLLSSISSFRNLVTVCVENDCCFYYYGGGPCLFRLTDDNVESLAIALPSLVTLRLGKVCDSETSRTTVYSLLSISVHCLELAHLEIHFNTLSIVDDIQRLFNGGFGHDKPRCKLRILSVEYLPLEVREEDIGVIAAGFADIFPCLEAFSLGERRERGGWNAVASKLRD